MDKTILLTLNCPETMILSDRLQNSDHGFGSRDELSSPLHLLIKMASLYVDLVEPSASPNSREGSIAVTEPEAWLMRSKIQSSDKFGSDNFFGIKLLRKIYQVLIEFDAGVDELLIAPNTGGDLVERRSRFEQWKQQERGNDELQPV